MFAWPGIERRVTGDIRRHDLLDRPRDRPTRTAIGAGFLCWVVIVFAVGSTDRLFYRLGISYTGQIHFWRVGVFVLPILVFLLTRSACRSLQRSGAHPLRGWQGEWSAAGPTARWRWLPKAPTDSSPSRPSRRSAPYPGTSSGPGGRPAAPPARACARSKRYCALRRASTSASGEVVPEAPG